MPSNFKYAAPLKGSNGFAGQMNGKVIKPGYHQSILAGLARGSTPTKTASGNRSRAKFTGYRFFSVPEARGSLKPGIYRAKGRGELQQLFSYLDQTPSVPSLWSFEEFAERESLPILERILPQFIEEALK